VSAAQGQKSSLQQRTSHLTQHTAHSTQHACAIRPFRSAVRCPYVHVYMCTCVHVRLPCAVCRSLPGASSAVIHKYEYIPASTNSRLIWAVGLRSVPRVQWESPEASFVHRPKEPSTFGNPKREREAQKGEAVVNRYMANIYN